MVVETGINCTNRYYHSFKIYHDDLIYLRFGIPITYQYVSL